MGQELVKEAFDRTVPTQTFLSNSVQTRIFLSTGWSWPWVLPSDFEVCYTPIPTPPLSHRQGPSATPVLHSEDHMGTGDPLTRDQQLVFGTVLSSQDPESWRQASSLLWLGTACVFSRRPTEGSGTLTNACLWAV